jgi:hypothetical protein
MTRFLLIFMKKKNRSKISEYFTILDNEKGEGAHSLKHLFGY